VVFAVASLLCGLASGPGMLVAARALQGLGASAMFATTLPLLGSVYQGRRRSVALGVWGAVSGAAAAVGPLAGGLLTEGPGWRWIFFVNLPVSVAAVWLTLRVVPESHGAKRPIDWAGTAAFAVFAGAATFGVVRAGEDGWGATTPVVSYAVAGFALLCFLLVERRVAHPLLDLSLFRVPAFTGVMAASFVFSAAAFGVLTYTSLWMQSLLGMSPVHGGLAMLPLSAAAFVVAAAGGRLLHGVPARLTVGGGLLLVGAGGFAQAVLDAGSTWTALVPGLVLVGVGTGLVSPAIAGAALAAVGPERAGMAGGAVNTFRQFGYALGVAVLGTVLTSRMRDTLTADAAHTLAGGGARALRGSLPEHTLRAAFASGLNSAALWAGAAATVAGVLVLLLVRTPRGASADPRPKPAEAVAPRG